MKKGKKYKILMFAKISCMRGICRIQEYKQPNNHSFIHSIQPYVTLILLYVAMVWVGFEG